MLSEVKTLPANRQYSIASTMAWEATLPIGVKLLFFVHASS